MTPETEANTAAAATPAPKPLTPAQLLEVRTEQLNRSVDLLRTLVGKYHALRCVKGDIPPEAVMPCVQEDLTGVEAALNSVQAPPLTRQKPATRSAKKRTGKAAKRPAKAAA